MTTGQYATDSELIREALREKEMRTAENEYIRTKLIAAEQSVEQHGWVEKNQRKCSTASKRKLVAMANYRVSPNAEADLERIWLYGLERWGLEASACAVQIACITALMAKPLKSWRSSVSKILHDRMLASRQF